MLRIPSASFGVVVVSRDGFPPFAVYVARAYWRTDPITGKYVRGRLPVRPISRALMNYLAAHAVADRLARRMGLPRLLGMHIEG